MSTTSPPATDVPRNDKRIIVSEDLPLTMLTAVATTLVMSALGLERELLYVGVALSPLVADVIKNAARGLRRRWLLLLTALLTLFGTTGRALAARLQARRDWIVSWHSVLATAALSFVLTVGLFTLPELGRGRAIVADRGTTFFSASRTEDSVPPHLEVPDGRVVLAGGATRVSYRAIATDGVDGPVSPRCSPRSGALFVLGTTTVRCSATDAQGNSAVATFPVTVEVSPAELVLVLPETIEVEAAGPDGARARYTVSAADREGARLVPRCMPSSGAVFPVGYTNVTCSATDPAGRRATGRFAVVVRDREPPTLMLPSDLSGRTVDEIGRRFVFDASASDRVDGTVAPACRPRSNSRFPIGTTTVSCTAVDAHGNRASGTFTVSLELGGGDPEPPILTLPSDVTEEARSHRGAVVAYRASARDAVDGEVDATCSPPPGSTFPLGTTAVHCSAQDSDGNRAGGGFAVTVADTIQPTIELPSDLTVEATSAAGALVAYRASARDTIDGTVEATCLPSPGSTFRLGTTTVRCSVRDSAGNPARASFAVTVTDKTPPALALSGDLVVEATSAAGALVVYRASATDRVDGVVAPRCAPPPRSTFAIGITTVSCSATDARGNSTSDRFVVSVVDTTPPALKLPGDIVAEARDAKGALVRYRVSAEDAVSGPATPTCSPRPGFFRFGNTQVTCTVTDARGNRVSGGFTVSVVDTTAPALTLPADFTVTAVYNPKRKATGASITYSASALDVVDGTVNVACSTPSGTFVAVKETTLRTVTCSAIDAHGNRASGAFTVTIHVPEVE